MQAMFDCAIGLRVAALECFTPGETIAIINDNLYYRCVWV